MYIWKCWYDTRKYFFFYLGMFLLAPLLILLSRLLTYHDGTWTWLTSITPLMAQDISQDTTLAFFSLGLFVGMFAGLSLGAAAIGHEFKNGTLEYLLTKPRPRRYFLWASWAVGVSELFVMLALTALVGSAFLLWGVGIVYKWQMLILAPLIFIPVAIIYGLAYLLAILLRGSINTQLASVGVLILYGLMGFGLNYYWQIELPDWRVLFLWIVKDTGEFPALSVAGWTLVALAFPLAAQWVFERAEIK